MTYQNQQLGIAVDIPSTVWDVTEKKEKETTIELVAVPFPSEQQHFRRTYGLLAPYSNQAIIIGINNNPEFVLFTDKASNETEAIEAVQDRYGRACRVSMQSSNNISRVTVRWEEGANLGTTQCKIPNVAYRILYSSSNNTLAFLFMNQEIRFGSKTNLPPNNLPGYDSFVANSLRFINNTADFASSLNEATNPARGGDL
ncbi:MAG: hypothetical protein AABZ06_02115 [Bdellovibrionota bacterium]